MFSLPRRAGGGDGGGPFGRGASRGWAVVGDVEDCRSVVAARPVPVPLLSRRRRRRGGSGSGRTGSGAVDVWRVARRAVVTGEPEANDGAAAVAAPTPAARDAAASEDLEFVPVPVPVPPRCRFPFRQAIPWMHKEKSGVVPLVVDCRRG